MPKKRNHAYDKNFTIMDNTMRSDKRLELQDIGLFWIMWGLPDDWDFSISGLVAYRANKKDGYKKIRSSLNRLIAAGYINRYPAKDKKGKITDWVYELDDRGIYQPHCHNGLMDNPQCPNGQMDQRQMDHGQMDQGRQTKDRRNKEKNKEVQQQQSKSPVIVASLSLVQKRHPEATISNATSAKTPTSTMQAERKGKATAPIGTAEDNVTASQIPSPNLLLDNENPKTRLYKDETKQDSAAQTLTATQQEGLIRCLHDEFGVQLKKGKNWMHRWSVDYINEQMEKVLSLQGIKNRGGALYSALQEDWAASDRAERKRQEQLIEASRMTQGQMDALTSQMADFF